MFITRDCKTKTALRCYFMSVWRLRAFTTASTHVGEAIEKAESSDALVGM